MTEPKTIGDTSRDGLLQIVGTTWGEYDPYRDVIVMGERDDTLLVTVREMIGGRDAWVGGLPVERMRRLAKSVRPHCNSRVVKQRYDGTQTYVMFALSRQAD